MNYIFWLTKRLLAYKIFLRLKEASCMTPELWSSLFILGGFGIFCWAIWPVIQWARPPVIRFIKFRWRIMEAGKAGELALRLPVSRQRHSLAALHDPLAMVGVIIVIAVLAGVCASRLLKAGKHHSWDNDPLGRLNDRFVYGVARIIGCEHLFNPPGDC